VVIPLPPLPEQKAIAQVLSTADAAINTNEKLIAQKELRKKWLMQQLLTGKKRLKGFDGEWKEKRLGDLLKEREIKSDISNEFEILTSSRKGLFYQKDYFNKQVASENNEGYKVIQIGDFTYRSMSDDNTFVFNQLDFTEKGLISPAYSVFYANNINDKFLLYLLNDHSFKRYINREIQGGTRTAFRFSSLKEILLPIPLNAEQTAIAHVLQTADREISLLQAKAEKLREQKKGLMQVLLTGKVRLKIKE
jgi:type I restriction enzyme S subunit